MQDLSCLRTHAPKIDSVYQQFQTGGVTGPKKARPKLSENGAERGIFDAFMEIVKHHWGAYGMAVEYAYTLAHGAAGSVYRQTSSSPMSLHASSC